MEANVIHRLFTAASKAFDQAQCTTLDKRPVRLRWGCVSTSQEACRRCGGRMEWGGVEVECDGYPMCDDCLHVIGLGPLRRVLQAVFDLLLCSDRHAEGEPAPVAHGTEEAAQAGTETGTR